MTDLTLTCSRIIKATPAQVYDAWLNPAKILRYMTMGPDMRAENARTDPRIGGRFAFNMVGDQRSPHQGTYTALDPHSRIAFTWETPWSAEGSHVDLRLTPIAGGTEVVLTHVRFRSEDSRDGHRKGWTGILERLDGMLVTA